MTSTNNYWNVYVSQGQTKPKISRTNKFHPAPQILQRYVHCTLYVYSLSIVNLIIRFSQDTVYNKSPPGIGEGRIIKWSAMATFYRDRQLSTDYGNDQFRHAILNKASWVMRFSSKWLFFKVPFCINCLY